MKDHGNSTPYNTYEHELTSFASLIILLLSERRVESAGTDGATGGEGERG